MSGHSERLRLDRRQRPSPCDSALIAPSVSSFLLHTVVSLSLLAAEFPSAAFSFAAAAAAYRVVVVAAFFQHA